jgi:CPA2 family monovalent cation:H+ antiporter-2
LLRSPFGLLGTLFVILVCSPLVALGIALAYGRPRATGLTLAASLAQIGEFSFILAGIGVGTGLLPPEGRDLILAGAIVSIFVNPLLFAVLERRVRRRPAPADVAQEPEAAEPEIEPTQLRDHAVIVGFGRVGAVVGEGLEKVGQAFLVVEERAETADALRKRGIEVIVGNAARSEVLQASNLAAARCLFVAIPDGFEAGQVTDQARAINPAMPIVARAHSDAEIEHLSAHGASFAIMGEREIALGMLEYVLGREAMPALTRPGAPT